MIVSIFSSSKLFGVPYLLLTISIFFLADAARFVSHVSPFCDARSITVSIDEISDDSLSSILSVSGASSGVVGSDHGCSIGTDG